MEFYVNSWKNLVKKEKDPQKRKRKNDSGSESSDNAPEKKTRMIESSEEPDTPSSKSKNNDKKDNFQKFKNLQVIKRKVESDEEADSDEKENDISKKNKKANDDSCEIPGAFGIGNNKFVTCSEFKGKQRIDIREYYRKDGKLFPGKKGMSLSIDEFRKLINQVPEMEKKFL